MYSVIVAEVSYIEGKGMYHAVHCLFHLMVRSRIGTSWIYSVRLAFAVLFLVNIMRVSEALLESGRQADPDFSLAVSLNCSFPYKQE